jgi:hypothetical protein
VIEIARRFASIHFGAGNILEVRSADGSDIDGKPALNITLVVTDEAAVKLLAATALKTLAGHRSGVEQSAYPAPPRLPMAGRQRQLLDDRAVFQL